MAPLTTTVSVQFNKCFWRGLLKDIKTMAAILDNGHDFSNCEYPFWADVSQFQLNPTYGSGNV